MKCPGCQSDHFCENGRRRGKQNHLCLEYGRQFAESPTTERGYSDDICQLCLQMYFSCMELRGVERVTRVHHTTVITWIKQVGERLPDAYAPKTTFELAELDELETFVGATKTRFDSGLL